MQLGFNLSNGVTDTFESSSILINLIQVTGIYTQMVTLIKTRNLIQRNTKYGISTKLFKWVLIGEGEAVMCEFNLRKRVTDFEANAKIVLCYILACWADSKVTKKMKCCEYGFRVRIHNTSFLA